MSSVQISTPSTGHVIPPGRLRANVLARRVCVSPEVASVMASLIFGEPRDHTAALPIAARGARS